MAAKEEERKNPYAVDEVQVQEESHARTAETVLRVVPMCLCLSALVVMLKNTTRNPDYGSLSYADIGSFACLVYADAICAAYSLLSAFYTAAARPPSLIRGASLFFFDQVMTYLILGAGAASASALYLAYNGDEEVTWSQQCGVFGVFCRRAAVSVGITLGSVVCYAVISLVSSYRLFSAACAGGPVPCILAGGEEEVTA